MARGIGPLGIGEHVAPCSAFLARRGWSWTQDTPNKAVKHQLEELPQILSSLPYPTGQRINRRHTLLGSSASWGICPLRSNKLG